ncbi:MAG: Dihydropteroate synthase [Candidatus Peregrinibacteria bacterium GW2011_GWA2_43_8]|nr:MAG: Dihydropteroate synthase [Candidatus Peregrinibacteria bacterium GW2011_GWA2_43_8]
MSENEFFLKNSFSLSDGLGVGVSLLCMLIKNFENQERFGDFLASVGVTSPGVMMMSGKGILRVIDIPEMDLRAANIFKQEALSIGAELALPREAAGLKAKKVRGVLIATNKQLEVLYMKLKMQPFGLRKIGDELMRVCSVYGRTEFSLRSPHGREVVLGHAVMGILNVTPDSFSDGGKIFDVSARVEHDVRDAAAVRDAVAAAHPDVVINTVVDPRAGVEGGEESSAGNFYINRYL